MTAELQPGRVGQFDVIVDGETIASRRASFLTRPLGMGYPDPEHVLAQLARRTGDA